MKNLRSLFVVAISICFLVGFVTQVLSAEQPKIQKQTSQPLKIDPTLQKETIFLCSVSGTLKFDPDNSNPTYHDFKYRGPVTFKALKDLRVRLFYFSNPKTGESLSCHCDNCPNPNQWDAFLANVSKIYYLWCNSSQDPTSGPVGKAQIEYIRITHPPTEVVEVRDCAGSFNLTQ